MRFLSTFFNFSKLISSLKAQVCNILKNHIDIQILLLNTDFSNYAIHKWFLHKFDFFINKGSRTRTKVSPTVPNLPSNDKITRFDATLQTASGCQCLRSAIEFSVSVPVSDWIPIQSGQWIRIRIRIRFQEGKNDPQKQNKIQKFQELDVLF